MKRHYKDTRVEGFKHKVKTYLQQGRVETKKGEH